MTKFNYNKTGTTHKVYPGKYKLSIFSPGYQTINEDIYVDTSDTIINKEFNLVPLPTNIQFPIKEVTGNGTCIAILDNSNNLFIRGTNKYGNLGIGVSYNNFILKFIQITTDMLPEDFQLPITNVISSESSQLFIFDNRGHIYVSGTQENNMLGLDLPSSNTIYKFTELPFPVNVVYPIKLFYNGWSGGVAIDSDNNIFQFKFNGSKTFTQIDSSIKPSLSGNILKISNKMAHIVMSDANNIYVKGKNNYGKLGMGTQDVFDSNTGDVIESAEVYNLTKIPTSVLPEGITFPLKCIATSYESSHIIDNSGYLYACGTNDSGELGFDNKTIIDYGYYDEVEDVYHSKHNIVVNAIKNKFTKIPTNLFPLDITFPLKQVQCGYLNTIILDNDGKLYGCGGNGPSSTVDNYGNYGNKFTKINLPVGAKIDKISIKDSIFIAVDNTNNKIYIMGDTNFITGVSNNSDNDRKIIQDLNLS